jgi:hypothetical protein
LFRVSTKIGLSDIVVKDIKGMLLLRPRLLKSLKACNRNYLKIKKTHLNITATFTMHTLIIRTKGVKSYIVSLIVCLQDLFIGLLVLRGYISKSIQVALIPVTGQ